MIDGKYINKLLNNQPPNNTKGIPLTHGFFNLNNDPASGSSFQFASMDAVVI